MEEPVTVAVSFATDIRPLFRVRDVNAMKNFDCEAYFVARRVGVE
jgi:hypothetical protein